jgi:hypothetical protein
MAKAQQNKYFYPSSLKWASSKAVPSYLLAGFSCTLSDGDGTVLARDGDLCIFDVEANWQLKVAPNERNVIRLRLASHPTIVCCGLCRRPESQPGNWHVPQGVRTQKSHGSGIGMSGSRYKRGDVVVSHVFLFREACEHCN